MTTTLSSPIFADALAGRRVVITGAARGLGAGLARAFGEAGASVMLADRDSGVAETAAQLASDGFDAYGYRADITDEDDVAALFGQVSSQWGGLDVLVNNAGVIRINDLEETTLDEFVSVLQVNTIGAFLTTRAAVPLLRSSGRGGVVLNAASGQARQGFIYTPAYAASKFGIVGMSQSLAKELAADNIRVNCYCPGIVKTDMWQYNDAEWGKRLGDYKPGELIEEWIGGIPLKRSAEPADVANLLLFLSSDAATYITGQAVNIDGGMFMS
jgi:meso-butanediol dehydrogenase/(S,S)-butanediol dehydrogenase/diacetyl reductase